MRKNIIILTVLAILLVPLAACSAVGGAVTHTPAATARPTPEPTPTPDPVRTRAEELLSGMNREEKLCQLLIVRPETLTGSAQVLETDASFVAALGTYPVGGLIYSQINLQSVEQATAMIDAAQKASGLNMFISVDEEGGSVARLMRVLGTTKFNSMYSYKDQGTDVAYSNAYTIGSDVLSCHFNTDFAPVADVRSNPENSVIGSRAYSDDFQQAAELVAAAVRGFRDSGVICSLKHFPGHGDTAEDSHLGPAVNYKTLEELRQQEFLPFVSGMEAGADMVMVGHISVPAVDDVPASVSYKLVTGILRDELGWDGVVVTDGLDMGALSGYTEGQKAVACLSAGCDILLGIADIPAALEGLNAALDDGTLSMARIDESVMRVLMLKLEHGIIA